MRSQLTPIHCRPWLVAYLSVKLFESQWAGELSKSEPVVVWCAYGFHVGCKTAIALRELGFDAKFMTGGHSAWKAIDGPTKPCA